MTRHFVSYPEGERRQFNRGVKAAIQWLHEEAARMNDPHARAILNSAAFHLGVRKPDFASVVADRPTEGEVE